MTKKDILILCQYFYPEYISSATLPYEMAKQFVQEGLSVAVITGKPKEYTKDKGVPSKEVVDGINIERLNYVQLHSKQKYNRLINFLSFIFAMSTKIFEFRKYETIFVYSNPPILPILPAIVKRLFRFNLVFVSYDVYPEVAVALGAMTKGSLTYRLTNLMNHFVFANTTKVVALSTEMKNHLIQHKKQLEEKHVDVIPNWYLDKNQHVYSETIQSNSKKLKEDGKTLIVYSGNMGLAQDMDTIIKTAIELKNNKDIYFVLVGHGSKIEYIKDTIRINLLSNIEVVSYLHGDEFLSLLQLADAYLISLEKGVEALSVPSKTYGYMAVGRPLLAIMSNTTDIAKDIEENNIGFVVRQGDVKLLSKKIEYLTLNKKEAKGMGMRCRKVYEKKYTDKICINQYVEMVRKLT